MGGRERNRPTSYTHSLLLSLDVCVCFCSSTEKVYIEKKRFIIISPFFSFLFPFSFGVFSNETRTKMKRRERKIQKTEKEGKCQGCYVLRVFRPDALLSAVCSRSRSSLHTSLRPNDNNQLASSESPERDVYAHTTHEKKSLIFFFVSCLSVI